MKQPNAAQHNGRLALLMQRLLALSVRVKRGLIRSAAISAMLAMYAAASIGSAASTAFGVAGLIAAPIYYAYLKDELSARGLV